MIQSTLAIMSNKLWTILGGLYATFAIVTFMAAVEGSPSNLATQTSHVATTSQNHVVRGQRLDKSNPRRDLFLTIWTVRNCPWCAKQKAEVPAMEKAGYNVVVRTVPAPRWVKAFPTTVVTKGKLNGERVTVVKGFKTLAEFDEILKIAPDPDPDPDPEDPEDPPDYNITGLPIEIFAVLPRNEIGTRQYRELMIVQKLYHVPVTAVFVGMVSTPLLTIMNEGVIVASFGRYMTATEIYAATHR